MTKEIHIPSKDIAVRISDTDYKPYRKRPTLSIRDGNCITKVASFNNMDSALYFFKMLCEIFNVEEG